MLFLMCGKNVVAMREGTALLRNMGALSIQELSELPGFSECSSSVLGVFRKSVQLILDANWCNGTASRYMLCYFRSGGEQRHAYAIIGAVVWTIEEKSRQISQTKNLPQTFEKRVDYFKKHYGTPRHPKRKFFFSRMFWHANERAQDS
jgi:hypothetical protein